jgi:hypothetical protein
VLGFEQPKLQADKERVGAQEMPVSGVDRHGMNLYQDFIILGGGSFDLFEL